MAGLTWLHLSDWHQRGENFDFDRKVVRDALLDDIKNRRKIHSDLEQLDFMVFSGDLAFSGKKEEYLAAAEHFLAPVLAAAGLDNSRLFIIPGNHDLDLDSFEDLPEGIKKPLTDAEEIKEWLEDDKKRSKMLEPFETFNEFVKDYAGGSFSAYAGSHQLTVDGKNIALLGFNSALMCGRRRDEKNEINDKGKIMVGEPQVYEPLRKNQDADLRIVVLHHPFDWLTEQDCIHVKGRLKRTAHFILCGHQHMPEVTIEIGTAGNYIMIPAGASYERRKALDPRYNNAYNFVHLDLENLNGEVYLRCWSDRLYRWREDIDAYPDGCFAFSLPNGSKTGKGIKPPAGPVPPVEPTKTVTPSPAPIVNYHPDNPVFNVPFRAKGDGLVGREGVLQKARVWLTAGQRTAIGHTAAFHGLGGLGKTQLAAEYAHRYRNEYPLGVVWINADQEIEPQLIRMAKEARWIHPESKPQDILEIAKQRLQTRSDCLVIFDNVEDPADIAPYLPAVGAEPHLLLTSRAPQVGFVPIDIPLLDDECSFQLLLKESGRDIDALPESEQKAAGEIAGTLGGLPLALEIAGAYLNQLKCCTFQSYRELLANNLKEAMKGDMLSSFTRHEKDLFLTLQVSQPELERAPLLNDVLDILAWSGSAFMGVSLLAALLDKKEAELFTPLQLGVSLHLLQKTPGGERYDIHRLMRRVRQEQFPITQRESWIKETCQRMGDWFEERSEEFTHMPSIEAEMDHLKQWLDHVKPYPSIQAARLTWLQQCPSYYWGRYQESHRLVQTALALLSDGSEPDPKLKANILNDLGSNYYQLGNFQKGLEYQIQALEIRKKTLGELHSDTAESLNGIGASYYSLGNYDKALENNKSALKIREKLFGEQHQKTATTLNNIGVIYDNMKNYNEGLIYKKRALEIQKRLFGEQHPDTAASFNNIGMTYGYLKDYKKALEYKLRGLEILQHLFGKQHPDTATSFNNVGTTYSYLGDHKSALEYNLQGLEIRQHLFGEHHPDYANSLHNVGHTYLNMGKPKEALNYFIRAFDIQCHLLGELHQNTAVTLHNLVHSLIQLKRFKEAEERIDDYFDRLPQDHPEYKNLSGLKKVLQKEERKSLHGIPGKKKKRK